METKEYKTEYAAALDEFFKNDEILAFMSFDISAGGKFACGLAAVNKNKLIFIVDGMVNASFLMDVVEEAVCKIYKGCGVLEIKVNGEYSTLARFSLQHSAKAAAFAEAINDIKANITVQNENNEDLIFCPECGKPFIKDTHVCRHCTKKGSVLKKIWDMSVSCRKMYWVLIILFWLGSITTIVSPMVTKHIVNSVLPQVNASVLLLAFPVMIMFALGILNSLVSGFKQAVAAKASNMLVHQMRVEIYSKLQSLSLGYIEKKKTGDLMQRINSDTHRLQSFIQDIAVVALNEIFLLIAIAVVAFSINYKMALLLFVPLPVTVCLIYRLRVELRRKYRLQWQKMDKLTGKLNDVLNGIKVVKVFGRENDEIRKFAETTKVVRDITCKNEKYICTVFPLINFISGIGSYLVLLYGGSCVIKGSLSVGELIQFSAYGSYLYSKLNWLSMLPNHVTVALTSAQRIFDILDEKTPEIEHSNKKAEDIKGEFEFKNLSFGYKSYEKVLHNINEHVKKGEMIGLVGHSGAGKSTLTNLVMQLYKPTRGELLLDNENLEAYNPDEYKKVIGAVLQENYLFSGSILDNIRYAVPDANIEACIEAAKKANAHDFILELPDGYDTNVGEKGYRLSGGERQRIALARAILSDPQILILDEATASVDSETEAKIQSSLTEVIKGRTVFAIAHRLSTLKQADRLFVFQNGCIAEKGTHDELMKKNGIYASLIHEQMKFTADTLNSEKTDETDVVIPINEKFEFEENKYDKN